MSRIKIVAISSELSTSLIPFKNAHSDFIIPTKRTFTPQRQVVKRGSLEWMKTLQDMASEEFSILDNLLPLSTQGQRFLLDRPFPMF